MRKVEVTCHTEQDVKDFTAILNRTASCMSASRLLADALANLDFTQPPASLSQQIRIPLERWARTLLALYPTSDAMEYDISCIGNFTVSGAPEKDYEAEP
jgi:hypothetical protein